MDNQKGLMHRLLQFRRRFADFAAQSFQMNAFTKGSAMDSISHARAQLDGARGLATTLDAALQGFEAILAVIRATQEDAGDAFAAFVLAAGAAADARDWLAAAPSLPLFSDSVRTLPLPMPTAQSIEQTAIVLVDLTASLTLRLTRAAKDAASPADEEACRQAAQQAAQITMLLRGEPGRLP